MAAGHVDPTIKANVLGNTVFDAVLDATKIAAWYNDVANKIDSNYDDAVSKTTAAITKVNFNGGLGFQNGDFSIGSISTDANWGGYIRGRSGTQADIAFADSADVVVMSIKSAITNILRNVILQNNIAIQGKETGGTIRNLLYVDTGNQINLGTAGQVLVLSSNGSVILNNGTTFITIMYGTGTPEGSKTASVGSLFLRLDGAATTTLYVKTSGTGNTGWTAK